MNKKTTFILWTSFIFLISLTQAQQKAPPSIMKCLGNYEILHSEILNEERTILIHVPDDYENSTNKYPVLYILDAENTKRFIHSIEAISFYSAVRRFPKMIVVGILNTNRRRDITPQKVKQFENTGGGAVFLKFITAELIPYIDARYRSVDFRILFGSSSAGMFTLYTLFHRPESFNAYIASRPALNSTPDYTWDSEIIIQKALQLFHNRSSLKKNLYIDHGGQEDALHDPVSIYKLADIFENNAPRDFYWKIHKMSESGYRSAESLKDGLLTIFSDWYFPTDSLITQGYEGINSHMENLSNQYNYSIDIEDIFDQDDLIEFGYRLLK